MLKTFKKNLLPAQTCLAVKVEVTYPSYPPQTLSGGQSKNCTQAPYKCAISVWVWLIKSIRPSPQRIYSVTVMSRSWRYQVVITPLSCGLDCSTSWMRIVGCELGSSLWFSLIQWSFRRIIVSEILEKATNRWRGCQRAGMQGTSSSVSVWKLLTKHSKFSALAFICLIGCFFFFINLLRGSSLLWRSPGTLLVTNDWFIGRTGPQIANMAV